MVGHAEVCQMLFGHVFGFVSQSASPRNPKILTGFGELCWTGQMQGWKQHFGPRLEAIFGPLRYLVPTALLLAAKLQGS